MLFPVNDILLLLTVNLLFINEFPDFPARKFDSGKLRKLKGS